jgi:hypothetical protein
VNLYKKINLDLRSIEVDRLKGSFYEGYGPFFKTYNILDQEYLDNYLKTKVIFHIPATHLGYTEVLYKGVTTPHTDTSMTALNYYINSNTGETFFYKAIDPSQKIEATRYLDQNVRTGSETYEYSLLNLEVIDSFLTNDHEAWLLNAHNIHCVRKTKFDKPRTILRWLWYDVPFDQVLNSIEILD